MIRLDGQELFASGPAGLLPGPQARELRQRGLAGLDGLVVVDLGRRGREITQTGRLQADTLESLQDQFAAIEAFADGNEHSLEDDLGRRFPRVLLESFQLTTPIQRGRGYFCDYRAQYRELP